MTFGFKSKTSTALCSSQHVCNSPICDIKFSTIHGCNDGQPAIGRKSTLGVLAWRSSSYSSAGGRLGSERSSAPWLFHCQGYLGSAIGLGYLAPLRPSWSTWRFSCARFERMWTPTTTWALGLIKTGDSISSLAPKTFSTKWWLGG